MTGIPESADARGLDARYELGEEIESGAAWTRHGGRDKGCGSGVSIDVQIAPARGQDASRRAALQWMDLSEPALMPVLDVGTIAGRLAVVSRDRETTSLAESLAAAPPEDAARRRLLAGVAGLAAALELAHARGLVHGAISTRSLGVTESGALVITRLGLSWREDALHELERAEASKMLAYRAPEQLAVGGVDLDGRADVWALACVAAELATGQPAFAAANREALMDAILRGEPALPSGSMPRALRRVVLRGLSRAPEDRPCAATWARELEDAIQGRGSARVHRLLIGVAVLVTLAVVAILGLGWGRAETELGVAARRRAGLERELERVMAASRVPDFLERVAALWSVVPPPPEELGRLIRDGESILASHEDVPVVEVVTELRNTLEISHAIERETLAAAPSWESCRQDLESRGIVKPGSFRPQYGLVPLGRDRDSGQWEFGVLRSGEPVVWQGEPTSGQAVMTDGAMIILVLIPGAVPWSPGAEAGELGVGSFYLAKHELTQAQWLATGMPSTSHHPPSSIEGGVQATLRHPAEHMTHAEAACALAQLRLRLPTESEWRHAARVAAGDEATTDLGPLLARANIADAAARRAYEGTRDWAWDAALDDGFPYHAPVGSLKPDALGLHDMIGNVHEWLDAPAGRPSPRIGGAFDVGPTKMPTWFFTRTRPTYSSSTTGLRAARSLD